VEAIRGNSCNSWTAKGAEVGVVQPEKVTTLNQDMTGGRHTANYTVVKNRTKDGYQLTVTAARRRSTPARRSLGVGWFEVERSTFDVQLFPGLKPFNYKLALLALTCHRDNPASAGFHLNRSPGESADPAALVAELIYVSAQALGVNNPFGEELEMHHLVIVILGE